jgi:catechol 2,3-dioxygenase-like lactoylglutathione lyase family enzyme
VKLNHLNLSVPDIMQTARFFEEFLNFRCIERKGQGALAVLLDEAGLSLVVSNFTRDTKPEYPKNFHLGFIQQRREQVEALYQRLQAAGYAKKTPQGMHGSLGGFYCTAPGDIQIEVSCPLDERA